MRHTTVTPEGTFTSVRAQENLDVMWNLIEDNYPEEWRLDSNGDVLLEVDDAMLERILMANYRLAYYEFGTYRGGQTPEGKRFLLRRPEHLKGTYIIKGIYTEDFQLVFSDYKHREYFFVAEGF